MKKAVLILLMGIVLINFVSCVCVENNDFKIGDEINICTKGCQYRNESNLSQICPCDNSVTCKLTTFYPNGTLISAYQDMSFDGNETFNYSFGKTLNITGIYRARIDCYRSAGWLPLEFRWSISSEDETFYTGRSSLITPSAIKDLTNELKDNILRYILFVGLGLFILILVYLDYKNHKYKNLYKKLKKDFGGGIRK